MRQLDVKYMQQSIKPPFKHCADQYSAVGPMVVTNDQKQVPPRSEAACNPFSELYTCIKKYQACLKCRKQSGLRTLVAFSLKPRIPH